MKRIEIIACLVLYVCLSLTVSGVFAAGNPAITFANNELIPANIGDTEMGKARVADGKLFMTANGGDVWGAEDSCFFLYKVLKEDFVITTKVMTVSDADPWSKMGVMVRSGLETGAVNAFMVASNSNGLEFQWRAETDSSSSYKPAETWENNSTPVFLRIARVKGGISASFSLDEKVWSAVETDDALVIEGPILVGLAASSHNAAETGSECVILDLTIK